MKMEERGREDTERRKVGLMKGRKTKKMKKEAKQEDKGERS